MFDSWNSMSKGQKFGAGAIGGGLLGGGLFGLANGYDNPADAAMPYLNKIPGQISPYYNPFIQQGQQAGNKLNGQYDAMTGLLPDITQQYQKMMSDPSGIINMLGSGYKQSPGYQWNLGQGEQAVNNANAAGGMLGTPQHQQQAGELASNFASQDYDNYMNRALGVQSGGTAGLSGLYNNGLQGQQGLQGQGYGASKSVADSLAEILGTQGQYAYAGKAGENQADSQNMSNLFGGLGSLASLAFL